VLDEVMLESLLALNVQVRTPYGAASQSTLQKIHTAKLSRQSFLKFKAKPIHS